MLKKTLCALTLAALAILPLTAWARDTSGGAYADNRLSSFLASPFIAAFDPAPQRPRPPIYSSPIEPPPGMCRWERQILDRHGRPVFDRHGQPLREYTIGPCWRPPY